MKADLSGIPFDHFQRYAGAAKVLRSLGSPVRSILEVGANRQRLLGEFLPDAEVLYTDIEPQQGPDFVVADATALPFPDGAFEAVVSLDVLEHMPSEVRASAVAEMARVAARVVVIACPVEDPSTHAAEREADSVWRNYFHGSYPWLEEHQTYGLVDVAAVEVAFSRAGLRLQRYGQGDTRLWSALMGAHFVKEAVAEFGGVVAAMDQLYNCSVFPADWNGTPYRQIFVGVRHAADSLSFGMADPPTAEMARVTASALGAIAAAMHPVAERVLSAERGWKDTAAALEQASGALRLEIDRAHAALREAEERLASEALAHHQTGLKLLAEARSAVAQSERADSADRRVAELQGELCRLQAALADAGQQLQREALAHHETGMKLVAEARSAVEQFERAEAADRMAAQEFERAEAAEQIAAARFQQLAVATQQLNDLQRAKDEVTEDAMRLQQRVRGLERRQQWALYAAGITAASILVMLLMR